jgi:hypothetical protein
VGTSKIPVVLPPPSPFFLRFGSRGVPLACRIPAVDEPRRYWFKRKRYGWGWGPPVTWQGWVAMALFVAAISAASLLAPRHHLMFALAVVGSVGGLLAICLWKGEPPGWRWGGGD